MLELAKANALCPRRADSTYVPSARHLQRSAARWGLIRDVAGSQGQSNSDKHWYRPRKF